MSLRSLAKHGIVVAVVTVLLSFMILLGEVSVVRYIVTGHDDYGLSIQFILKHVGLFVSALLAALTAVLMIWGIVKKHPTLLLPWLTLYTVAAILFSCINWYEIITKNHQLDDILFGIILMGFEIIVVYPIFILFADLRYEIAACPEEAEDESMYRSNVEYDFDYVLPKTML